MKIFTSIIFCLVAMASFSQMSRKTFIITSAANSPVSYDRISSIDINGGKALDNIYDVSSNYQLRNGSYRSYTSINKKAESTSGKLKEGLDEQLPMVGSVACMAYDGRNDRLFYIPQQLSELRYLDLKQKDPSFTYLANQSLNLLHNRDDVANQVTRMTIGADGFGYALTNDGEHLIKFSTQEMPVIQDLGVLIDNPANKVLVRSSCTSWGGDMVGDVNGNLYLVSVHNHVFRISLPSKKCDFIGTIKNLPESFTSNGASVDENGDLVVSCGTSLGKNFSALYKVKWPSLEAEPVSSKITGADNISDMASSNLLFQKNEKKAVTGVSFNQAAQPDENNLPSISIFPNPVLHGRFQVKASNIKEQGEYAMSLVDATGKSIMNGKLNLGLKMNTSSFAIPAQHAKGIYFVQITDIFKRTIFSQQLILE